VLAKLFEDRGVILDRTYQLNVGGNMDFKNMLERDRLESKKISKTQAVTSNMENKLRRATYTSDRRTTCSGSTTASGPTSGSRAATSATCR
jgi:myo-inositol-1-phosphate synthase